MKVSVLYLVIQSRGQLGLLPPVIFFSPGQSELGQNAACCSLHLQSAALQ